MQRYNGKECDEAKAESNAQAAHVFAAAFPIQTAAQLTGLHFRDFWLDFSDNFNIQRCQNKEFDDFLVQVANKMK